MSISRLPTLEMYWSVNNAILLFNNLPNKDLIQSFFHEYSVVTSKLERIIIRFTIVLFLFSSYYIQFARSLVLIFICEY